MLFIGSAVLELVLFCPAVLDTVQQFSSATRGRADDTQWQPSRLFKHVLAGEPSARYISDCSFPLWLL